MSVFKFEPIYKKRIWGGQQFHALFDHGLDCNERIVESWNIVDREDEQSFFLHPNGNQQTIRSLIEGNCHEIMGPSWKKDRRFPILVKWLDCHARLSLQVHPPADIASSLNGEPKTENWYIVNCTEEAGIILGLKKGVTKLQFQEALKQNSAENLCHKIPSKPNDSVLVESGRMHAIDAGNLILEIQQNSDTTFRVYDWGRNGEDGKPRNLHIEESMKCIDFNDYEPCTMTTCTDLGEYTIAQSELFRIRKFNLAKGSKTEIKKPKQDCVILCPIRGILNCESQPLNLGYSSISPYSDSCEIHALEDSTILITDRFCGLN